MRVGRSHADESVSTVNSKDHVKLDIAVLVVTFLYYIITQFRINQSFSSGYSGIWWFFTLEHLVLLCTQVSIIASDIKQKKTLVLSIRSCAVVLVVGSSLITAFLGLPTPWLIIYFCMTTGSHFYLFSEGLKMSDDPPYSIFMSTEMTRLRRIPIPSES